MAVRSHVAILSVAALLGVGGCERPAERVAFGDTPAPTPPADTVVRRVIRVARAPSAMQRATGVVKASRALAPLDSTLVIRVFDRRGVEMAGVPVRWSLLNAGSGAELRLIDARTDSLGLSRAAFTPGLTASAQSVVAEVAGVGRIDFAVSVTASSIRIRTERQTLWSGDDLEAVAELRDAAGVLLPGGAVSWASTDPTVLHVVSSDSTIARVRGALAGEAQLVAWIEDGSVRGHAPLAVRPVVSGRFVTINGRPPPRIRLEIRAGAARDTTTVEHGAFARRVELPQRPDAELRAQPIDDSAHHSVHLRTSSAREVQGMTIALVPRAWRIDAGRYQGTEIPIDAELALRRSAGSSGFWRIAPVSGRGPKKILGWRHSDFPLRIAFDRARSNDRVSPEDSAAFWRIAEQMQSDIGAELFVPAELRRDSVARGVIPLEIAGNRAEGHAFLTWDREGEAYDGMISLRSAATMRNPHVVTHELLHLLGFGHSALWRTVSQPVGGTEARLTPEDVAYAQVALRLQRLQQQSSARPGLPIAFP